MRTEARNATPFFYRAGLLKSFGQLLCRRHIDAVAQFDDPHRRHRVMGLEGFIWLGLLVASLNLMDSLEAIFEQIGKLMAGGASLPIRLVSVSAFTQLRQRFPLRVLLRLWMALAKDAHQAVPPRYALWRGFRLRAMDGTTLNLPEALWPYFRAHHGSQGQGPVQGHLVLLYDLHSRVPVRLRLGAVDDKERPLALKLLNRLGPEDLLLIDGGFYSIFLFAILDRRGRKFIIPMRKNGKPKQIRKLGPNDGIYEIRASKKYWKDVPGVPERMIVRIVTVKRRGFRDRRLVSNLLDPQAFPAKEIAEVYHQRWHIETFYRELKHTLRVEHWHARKPRSLYAELFFMMILATLTRLAMADAAGSHHPPGGLSFSKSLRWMQTALVISAMLPMPQWLALYAELLEKIRRCRIDVRPNRRFERDRQKRRKAARAKRLASLNGVTQ